MISVVVGEQNMTKAFDIARKPKLMFLVTEDWYFVSHRLELAVAAREAGYDVIVATRVDRHGKRITDAGLTLRSVAFDRSSVNPLKELRTLVHLARLYHREAPDIAHHVALKPVIYGSLVARIVRTKGVVNALGGLGYVFFSAEFRAKVLRAIAKPVLRWLLNAENTQLIVQNADDEERLVAAGVVKVSSIRVIRGAGVDPDAYRQVDVTTDVPLVVFPARFLRVKGIIEFVDAARALRAQGVKARFALVGRPDPANPTSVSQAEVDGWVGEGFVEAWGWRDDMPAVFSQAQIVCLPSYHGEGIPKSLLEAAASGCAIVATDIPGCREVAQPGKTGWLVPAQDTLALAEALRVAIEQPGLRQQYGTSARTLVASDFSISRVAAETIAVYEKLMAQNAVVGS